MNLGRMECISLMQSREWLEEYSRVKQMVEELNANCCRDNNRIVCTMCKYSKECKIISAVRGVMNI